jgi:hypothetical protein
MTNVRVRLQFAAVASLSLTLLASAPTEEEKPTERHVTGTVNNEPQVAQPKARKPSSPPGSPAAVAAKVLSKDECQTDADCVPAAPCHASTCAPAPHKVANVPCTMECRGGTVDCGYNHCGCVKGRSGKKVCALVPGSGGKR